jgi:hypothetical protein
MAVLGALCGFVALGWLHGAVDNTVTSYLAVVGVAGLAVATLLSPLVALYGLHLAMPRVEPVEAAVRSRALLLHALTLVSGTILCSKLIPFLGRLLSTAGR